jgi:protein-S-isoprenylcysteine O-methyltransferase Ste14
MHNENVFRVVLIVGFALVLPIALYYRLKSQASKEKLDRREEGLFILLTLRPVGVIGMMGMIAYLIRPSWMAWSSVPLPSWLRWAGVGLGAFAALLFIRVLHTLGTNLTDTVVTRARHTLVTTGPYRWVRHPFYVASALAVAANSIVAANWFIAVAGAATVGLLVIGTSTEEEKLIERFGEEYRNYMRRTGRFFPRLKK